jgi:hypothetical protein
MKLHSWLHLWITGLQGTQAEPFKTGNDFAAVNTVKSNKDMDYGPAVLTNIREELAKEWASSRSSAEDLAPTK